MRQKKSRTADEIDVASGKPEMSKTLLVAVVSTLLSRWRHGVYNKRRARATTQMQRLSAPAPGTVRLVG